MRVVGNSLFGMRACKLPVYNILGSGIEVENTIRKILHYLNLEQLQMILI